MPTSAAFHPLRVAAIDELTDDAVASPSTVPAELRRRLRASPHGQHLTIRGGDDERRSYSICTPPSLAACSGSASSSCPGGAFSEGVVGALRVGDELDVMTPGGPVHHRRSTRRPRKTYVAIAAGSGHHAGALDRRRDPRGRAGLVGHAGLRQPHPPHGDVPRRGARPQGPLPRAAPARARALPREPGRRAVLRPARRRPAAPDPRRAAAGRRGRRLVPVRAAADGRRAARGAHRRTAARRTAIHTELFHADPVPRAPGRRAGRAEPRAPRT